MIASASNSKLFLVGFAVVLLGVVRLFLRAFEPALRQIPGPTAAKFSSLWRVRLVWNGTAHEGYRDLHKKYGPIVRTAPNVVDISDPSAILPIYGISSQFKKSEFYSVFADPRMESLFTTRDSEEHKLLKRPVAQWYSMTSIRSLEYLVDPCSHLFTDAMTDLQGEVIDLGTWVQWYAFDVIGAITFGSRFGFMETRKDVQGVINGIEVGLTYCGVIGQIPVLHKFLLGNMIVRKVLGYLMGGKGDPMPTVEKMVTDSIEEYTADADGRPGRADFLAVLHQQEKKTTGLFREKDTLNHLMNNLLAGSDTTGISLRAVFYYVLKTPRAYKVLQQEIDKAEEAGELSPTITYSESLRLEYLQACMKEAMRLHPGVAFPLERMVPPGGATLCGTFVPAGTIVGINAAVIHRDTAIFGQDANEFRPERWMGTDEAHIKEMDRHLLTFGAGVRSCVGKNISIMEMSKLVPQVLRQFSLEWASSEKSWQVHTYWFAKQKGLHVRMKARRVASAGGGVS